MGVDAGWLEAVDLVDGSRAVAGEGAEHVARAGVVGGDHAVFARHVVRDRLQLIEHQDIQIGGAQLDVVGRVEEIFPRGGDILPLCLPVGFAASAGGDQLHEPIGRSRADRKGIEVALRADDGEDQAGADVIVLRELVDQRPVFIRLLHGEVGDHRNFDEVGRLLRPFLVDRSGGRFLFQEIGREGLGFCRRAHRLILLIVDEAEEVGGLVAGEDDFFVGK